MPKHPLLSIAEMSGEDIRQVSPPAPPHGAGTTSSSSTAPAAGGSTAVVSGRSSALPPAPPGFRPVRRSMTAAADMTDAQSSFRRRSSARPISPLGSFDPPKRRYSALSDEIFNPSGTMLERHEISNWTWVPLAFALLPAFGGLFFKNGSSIATDVILLGLSAVFLRWAVTQPWIWYYSAQQIRVGEEMLAEREMDMEEESEEIQSPQEPPARTSTDGTNGHPPEVAPTARPLSPRRRALGKLYLHEVSALASCFLFPLAAAVLLHTIRGQLSRPSEGLVSNYNLTIFLLAAEIRPLGQLMKLFQARTLHLQRVVDSHPYRTPAVAAARRTSGVSEEVIRRLDDLESHAVVGRAGLVQDVRRSMQPEIDAMQRAIRQYEKRMATMAVQMDSRLGAIDTRLNDAVALAAEAARGAVARRSFVGWLTDMFVDAAMVPPNVMLKVMTFPVMVASKVLGRSDAVPLQTQTQGPPGSGHHKQGSGGRRAGKERASHS